MERTCVRINLGALIDRLSVEQGHDVSFEEAQSWLARIGFVRNGDWHCDGESVRLLWANEILARRDLEEEDGIVFVL